MADELLPEARTYGLRRKGTTEVIGIIPAKVHAAAPTSKEFLRDYEEVPLYTHDQAREAVRANLAARDAEIERLREALRRDAERLRTILPVFEEARDALCCITEVQRRKHGISKTLADRMDALGCPDAAMRQEGGE